MTDIGQSNNIYKFQFGESGKFKLHLERKEQIYEILL